MGNSLFRSKKVSPEEEQRRLQQHHGVLIPPLFTVSNDDGYASSNNGNTCTTIPISSQAQWKVAAMNNPQNIMTEYLWRLTAGYNLLNEYMTPGIYFAVPTNKTGQILVSLNIPQNGTLSNLSSSTDPTKPSSSSSFLSLSQQFLLGPSSSSCSLPHLNVQLLIPASPHLSPYIDVSTKVYHDALTLSARCNPFQPNDSIGHVNALLKLQPVSGMHTMVGAWMTADSIHNTFLTNDNNNVQYYYDDSRAWDVPPSSQQCRPKSTQQPQPSSSNSSLASSVSSSSTRNYSPNTLHVQGVAEYKESIMAMHAEVPLSPNSGGYIPEQMDTLLWINLSGSGTSSGNEQEEDHIKKYSSPSSPPPPLWLTLKQSTTRGHAPEYTLNLSQMLSFDRTCWNILEDRAPLIRNHVGWTFQLQKRDNAAAPQWSMGTSWQINRNIACKVVLCDNGHYLRSNVILKKWQQPRVTLSLLNGIDLVHGTTLFWGCGFEVETTTAAGAILGNNTTDAGYQESANVDGRTVPPTKIQVSSSSSAKR